MTDRWRAIIRPPAEFSSQTSNGRRNSYYDYYDYTIHMISQQLSLMFMLHVNIPPKRVGLIHYEQISDNVWFWKTIVNNIITYNATLSRRMCDFLAPTCHSSRQSKGCLVMLLFSRAKLSLPHPLECVCMHCACAYE